MGDSSITLNPGTGGAVMDTETTETGEHREVVVIGGSTNAARVLPANAQPADGAYAVPVRLVPAPASGGATETTLSSILTRLGDIVTELGQKLEPGGTVAVNNWPASQTVNGTVAVTGPLTDAQLRAVPVPVNLDRAGTLALGTQTAVSSAAVQILPANAARRVLIVQNVGLASLRFGGAGVTATTGMLLQSGQTVAFTMPDTPTGAVFAIRSLSGDTTAFAMEF